MRYEGTHSSTTLREGSYLPGVDGLENGGGRMCGCINKVFRSY